MLEVIEYNLQLSLKNSDQFECKLIRGGNADYCDYKIAQAKYFSDEGIWNIINSLNQKWIVVYKNLYLLNF